MGRWIENLKLEKPTKALPRKLSEMSENSINKITNLCLMSFSFHPKNLLDSTFSLEFSSEIFRRIFQSFVSAEIEKPEIEILIESFDMTKV
jgi:hypothetical protein